MSADIICADFKTKTWHKPESLEHLANVIFADVFAEHNDMILDRMRGVPACSGGSSFENYPINEMPPVQPVYHAPPEDCA